MPDTREAIRAPALALTEAAILPTLLALALPNMLALSLQSGVAVVETHFIGHLGTEALAAMALVFPTIALSQMMSAGAMGGGVSSAISRALGAGDLARARTLALHAIAIGCLAGTLISAAFHIGAPALFRALGGDGTVLAAAIAYAQTFFTGAVSLWLFNTLLSVVRGSGDMRLPSLWVMIVGALQIALGALLGLGLAGFPRLGLPGIAMAQVIANTCGAIAMIHILLRPQARLRISFEGAHFQREMFRDILKVGAVACLSPIQSILVVVLLARFAAGFGTDALAGFGIGLRLELLLVPIGFAIGVACVPMVGMSIGAGRIARARHVAWTGALLSASLIGGIGIVLSQYPHLWGSLFTSSPAVMAAVDTYLRIAGFGFPAYGLGLCLYFAAQGSGKILGLVLAGTVRLAVVILGGWYLINHNADFAMLAWLVCGAMLAYGLAAAIAIWFARWG